MKRQLSPHAVILLAFATGVGFATVIAIAAVVHPPARHRATIGALAVATCTARGDLPDPVCTPGTTNPDVTQATIATTICVPGWTRTIRPPSSYTTPLKRAQMAAYGYIDDIATHEEDHLIPLELGGATRDPLNLWPEPDASPNPKDHREAQLKRLVCAGTVTLAAAQDAIRLDWPHALDLVAAWCPHP